MRLLACLLILVEPAAAALLTGTVRDPGGKPVAGAAVRMDGSAETKTGEDGAYRFETMEAAEHQLTAESDRFLPVQRRVAVTGDVQVDLRFTKFAPSLISITVSAEAGGSDPSNPDPARRIYIRDEILDANPGRPGAPLSIPGLPVETASGGIKAPQYFAPGIAGDHGEPIAQFFQVGSYLVPNNLSANAHGNGYADPNVIIPAVIESVQTDGGAFNVLEGNHAVNLGVTYGFRSRLEPFATIAADAHDVDVAAGWSPSGPATHAWLALEAAYGNGFLKTPEHRRQYKINGYRVFDFHRHQVTLFGLGYFAGSRIPGLVPIHVAGLGDTVDPRQRDRTHTGEIDANDVWRPDQASEVHLSGFFRTYDLALFSNFGDGLIRQSEFRTAEGAQARYVRKIRESASVMAGVDYSREAPRRLDLDRYGPTDPALYGPFHRVTANDVTLNDLSQYLSVDGRLTSWLRFNLGWRFDEIGFTNRDLLTPSRSSERWTGIHSPKATVNFVAPQALPLPSLSLSFGEAFFTNDPRMGVTSMSGTAVSRARAWQAVAMKIIRGTELRVTLGHLTQEQSLAKIDPDTGLQFNQGPGRNRYLTFSACRRWRRGIVEASFSKANARDLSDGTPLPEAPRLIFDVLATIDRLPLSLKARGEFEEVGRKPLGDGFNAVPIRQLRGALVRPFWKGRLDAGVHFLIATGYTGQTTEVITVPGDALAERIVGVRMPSYAGAALTLHF
jgi:hypothetical protein